MPDTVTHRRIAALWYVWGAQDNGALTDVDADAFADFHAGQAQDYVDEQVSFLPSLRDALTQFVERTKDVKARQG